MIRKTDFCNDMWKAPKDEHIVYEALSALADGRLEKVSERMWKCFSASRNKYYTLLYDQELGSIMSNDNVAYYLGEVSYPMVALFIQLKEIVINEKVVENFKDIKWKNINQRNKNDYMKSVEEVLENLSKKGVDIEPIKTEVDKIFRQVCSRQLSYLGKKMMPPTAY